MSVSMWSYRPEVCDGGGCPGDCDLCDKPKNMEDEPSDCISRQAAIEAVGGTDLLTKEEAFWAVECIKEVPAADVVEVVRCKDCKHRLIAGRNTKYPIWVCQHKTHDVCADDFCSYGERTDK